MKAWKVVRKDYCSAIAEWPWAICYELGVQAVVPEGTIGLLCFKQQADCMSWKTAIQGRKGGEYLILLGEGEPLDSFPTKYSDRYYEDFYYYLIYNYRTPAWCVRKAQFPEGTIFMKSFTPQEEVKE